MIVTAHIKQRTRGARDQPEAKSDHLQVEADTYEDAQSRVRSRLPEGWIVASFL